MREQVRCANGLCLCGSEGVNLFGCGGGVEMDIWFCLFNNLKKSVAYSGVRITTHQLAKCK
jgi:hypothetical protein